MLSDINMDKKDSAVKCLEILSTAEPDNWMHILNAGKLHFCFCIKEKLNEV